MIPTHEQHNDFLAHKHLDRIVFEHNDCVDIIGGEYAGRRGSIIGVKELEDDPIYWVELGASGKDVFVKQSWLRKLEN